METSNANIAHQEQVTDAKLEEYFAQALALHEAEDLRAAEDFYQKVLFAMPDQPNVNYNLGMLKVQQAQSDESLNFFKAALAADETEPKYWVSYVEALMLAGHKKLAVDTLLKGLEVGLHGEEVDALVAQLTVQEQKPAPIPVTIAQYAGMPDMQALTQTQKTAPVAPKPKKQSKTGKTLQHYLENPKIQKALAIQQSGDLKAAKKEWLRLLKYYPKQPVILTCLGAIALEQSHIDDAKQWLTASLDVLPEQATAWSYLSIIHLQQADASAALADADQAIVINPSYAEAHANRGGALKALKRFHEALKSYQQALALQASNSETQFNLALVYVELAQYEEAAALLKDVIATKPSDAVAYHLCAEVHKEMKAYDKALGFFQTAIKLDSNNHEAMFGRGLTYLALRQYEAAHADFAHVVQLKPNYRNAYINIGLALSKLGKHEASLEAYDQALALDDAYAETYNNKGLLLVEMQRFDEALTCYEKAIALDPNFDEVYWNKSHLHLLLGDFRQGWPLYEYRWKSVLKDAKRAIPKPLWLGEQSIAGKTLLVYPEQGLGDFIQFSRYVKTLESLGAQVVLEVPTSLTNLIATMKGHYQVVEQGSVLPAYDYHCPILSLPLALKTQANTIPAETPYLYAGTHQLTQWQSRIDSKQFNVGLVWSGASGHMNDHHRSIPLATFKPLLDVKASFHCLQKEIKASDQAVFEQFNCIHLHGNELTDFSETAALIAQMDLVITVDTSVAHLVGAMNKTCWLLLPYAPDFRWMVNTDTSPWYPSMQLFRQPKPNDWVSVMAEVKQSLVKIKK